MGDIGKVIKISTEDYESLHELKFDLRVDTYGEVVHYLIKKCGGNGIYKEAPA